MKKYLGYTAVLFLLACNSNDKQSDKKAEETEKPQNENISTGNTESGSGLLSGKFEIIDYKKDNVKIELPNTVIMEFTKNGDVIKPDGVKYLYKIEGDSIAFLTDPTHVTHKAKIDFLKPDNSSFIVRTPLDKTEITYKKIKD
jgi:hypothetical protein